MIVNGYAFFLRIGICILSLLALSSQVQFASDNSNLSAVKNEAKSSVVDTCLTRDREIFVKFYNYLYRDIKDLFASDDELAKRSSQIFDEELSMMLDGKTKCIRIRNNDKAVVGFMSIAPTGDEARLRLRRFAADISKMKEAVDGAKKLFSQWFPNAKSIIIVCMKDSRFERRLLSEFGFVETTLIEGGYDPKTHISYAYSLS
jgi:hypothetical protein